MVPAHNTGHVKSGDVVIHYRRLGGGDNTPILFVHGLSFFSYDWLTPAQALGADREAACMDMRGFGDSEWSLGKDYSVESMGKDIVNLLDHLGWERAVLCGHSMGGRSSTYAAVKYPTRVVALILVDYSPDNAPAGAKRVAQTVGNTPDAFKTVDDAMRYFHIDPHSSGGRAKRERFEAYLRTTADGFAIKRDPHFREQFRRILAGGERPKVGVDMWQLLRELACPTLVVRGARSDMFAGETVAKVRAANSRIRVVEIDAGHNIAGDNPEGFLAAVRPFLSSL